LVLLLDKADILDCSAKLLSKESAFTSTPTNEWDWDLTPLASQVQEASVSISIILRLPISLLGPPRTIALQKAGIHPNPGHHDFR
jgi:hypothetical protein